MITILLATAFIMLSSSMQIEQQICRDCINQFKWQRNPHFSVDGNRITKVKWFRNFAQTLVSLQPLAIKSKLTFRIDNYENIFYHSNYIQFGIVTQENKEYVWYDSDLTLYSSSIDPTSYPIANLTSGFVMKEGIKVNKGAELFVPEGEQLTIQSNINQMQIKWTNSRTSIITQLPDTFLNQRLYFYVTMSTIGQVVEMTTCCQ